MTLRKSAAWLVHLYTAAGGFIGLYALFVAAEGQYELAFLLLGVTVAIDATDGLLARWIRVKEVLPTFDGAMVDNIIDFLTYIWVPAFILVHAEIIPHPLWSIIPVIAGLYVYGQTTMKTDDNFFLGFPSYWNIVALYLYLWQPGPVVAVLTLVIPGILSFVPTRYLYPSRNRFLAKTTWALAVPWLIAMVILLLQETPNPLLLAASALYPLYYLVASFYADYRIRRGLPL